MAEPFVYDDAATYTGDPTSLAHTRTYEWCHPMGDIISGLLEAGLRLEFLHEHERLPALFSDDGDGRRLGLQAARRSSGCRCLFHCGLRSRFNLVCHVTRKTPWSEAIKQGRPE
jgi:hypothetical protein